ncbi:hypothetical protein K474DRAFT_435037 [Panus rudis PR-1116 ss-1]|nr:hypothetical protein K474DRAFT_435037 [Panus rudis PR-1116 ss-1]
MWLCLLLSSRLQPKQRARLEILPRMMRVPVINPRTIVSTAQSRIATGGVTALVVTNLLHLNTHRNLVCPAANKSIPDGNARQELQVAGIPLVTTMPTPSLLDRRKVKTTGLPEGTVYVVSCISEYIKL